MIKVKHISFDLDVMLLTPNDEGYETQSEQVSMTWDISNLPVSYTHLTLPTNREV